MMKKKVKKKIKGKSKGNSFERTVSRLLDDWWEEPRNTFWRTVLSGGWKEPGDISPRFRPNQNKLFWPFIVECKFYKKFSIEDILIGKKTAHLAQWWKQLTKEQHDAIEIHKRNAHLSIRLLICKYNHGPILVGITQQDFLFNIKNKFCKRIDIYLPGLFEISLFTWEEFKQAFTREYLEERIKESGYV